MDRLDAMTVVVAVAEKGSLSAAARHLDMPLPTVSRKLSDLETHLKARLFNRSTRRLVLTDAGADYFAACKRIIEEVNEAERTVGGEFSTPKGEMVISAPILFGRLHVLPAISAFLNAYPQVRVRLVQSDRWVNLLEDRIDLALRIGELAESRLVATRCGVTRQIVCASPQYLADHGTPKRPDDLADHSLIAFEGLASADHWSFKVDDANAEVAIRPRLAVTTADAAIDAALSGLGLTRVLSYQVQQALDSGKLVAVLKRFELPPVPISLVYSKQRHLPVKVRAFLDFVAPRLRAALA
jgi:DNA-binding transcriptional LysR family regulator